jgi:alpha-tubulin suppressor-like RCC1 family protein
MLGVIVIALVVSIGIGVIVYYATMPKPQERDVFEDFKTVKKALTTYHKTNLTKCSNLNQIKHLLGSDALVLMSHYGISSDEKFLIVHSKLRRETVKLLLERIDGLSYEDEETGKLYLALLQFKISEIDPVAVITYFPKENLSTTTKIEWKSNDSKVERNEIKQEEWLNKQERFIQAGEYTVSLRVQDRNDNWSEWTHVSISIKEEKGVKGIVSGATHVFRIKQAGQVEAFGKNKYGQVGDGTLNDYEKFKRISSLENIAMGSAGESHSLFKHYDGTASACGNNDFGQLGNGTRNNSKSPTKIWGLEHVRQVVAGPDYSLAVLASGAVLTWGNNEHGQLGEEKLPYRELPKRVKDVSKVKQASCSATHVVCVHHDGTLTAWGDNSQGQLGTGFKSKVCEPVIPNAAGVFYVAVGLNFTILVMDNGRVKGFGHNNYGQLGIQGDSVVLFAKEIPELKNIVKAVAFESFVVAINDVGEVYTWGRYSNKEGETYYKPQRVAQLKYVKDIACSPSRGYALLEDGKVARWSGNIDLIEVVDDLGHPD